MQEHKPVIFGKYCLLERVNVGGMAEVYRARPFNAPNFKRFLAVKRILPNLAEDSEFIDMFIDEAKIAVQLNHHNVCQIYELGKLNESYYIVMEFIAGRDLLGMQNYFRRRRRIMAVSQAAFIISKVCEGLDYAHKKKDPNGQPMRIVHRDISPQNVLVAYDGDVKVIDFGIARAATKNNKTQVGVLKGKFGYMSPEQVTGKDIDHRSDVFAVGALLWELLTARRLFHGETDFATLEKVRAADVAPPSTKNSKVPPELDAIVLKALAQNRDERYQSAGEMARALERFLSNVRPPYSKKTLSSWMVTAFADKLREERTKVDAYRQFVTADDVREYNDRAWEMDDEIMELDLDDMEDDDATQVFEADAEFLEGLDFESESSMVIAANELEPLQTVVSQGDVEYDLPDLAGGTDRYYDTGRLSDFQTGVNRFGSREKTLFAVLAVLLIGAAVLAAVLLRPEPAATLYVDTTPSVGVQVYIDGQLQSGQLPLEWPDLEEGTVFVEIRHPDFEPLVEQVTLVGGETVRFERELVPLANGQGTLIIALGEHPEAQIYVDGEAIDGSGTERRVDVLASEDHVVEVYVPGFFVEEYEVSLRNGQEWQRDVTFRPVVGSISLSSTPSGTVYVDDEERGVTSSLLSIDGLDPLQVHELEVRPRSRSYRTYRQNIIFDGGYNIRIAPRLPRVTEDDVDASVPYGYLTASADDWYRVYIDGRDSGFVTPITEQAPLPISAGEHTIEFVRGGERSAVTLTFAEEETTHAERPTP